MSFRFDFKQFYNVSNIFTKFRQVINVLIFFKTNVCQILWIFKGFSFTFTNSKLDNRTILKKVLF